MVTDSVQVRPEVRQHLTPDLIVCDHKLESSNAIDVHQQLSDTDAYKGLPFMVTFNGRDVNDIEKLIKSEVGDILLSPYASLADQYAQEMMTEPGSDERLDKQSVQLMQKLQDQEDYVQKQLLKMNVSKQGASNYGQKNW